MTQEEIIEMARQAWISNKEAQLITEFDEAYISCTYVTDLEAFAKLVAEKEREACAKYVESLYVGDTPLTTVMGAIGDAIRARGQA